MYDVGIIHISQQVGSFLDHPIPSAAAAAAAAVMLLLR